MGILKVALLQLIQNSDAKENLKKGYEYCRLAKKMGADIALFPEMWNNGEGIFVVCFNIDELRKYRESQTCGND